MSLEDLIQTHPWTRYSKKMAEKILSPRNVGFFTSFDAQERGMLCIQGEAGSLEEGNWITLYWLLDETDGVIVDAKFQLFGQSPLIAAADSACELVVGKNYDQAKRISVELIDKKLRDKPEEAAFPKESYAHLNLVLEALEVAAEKCKEIPLPAHFISPVPQSEAEQSGYPGWLTLPLGQKLAVIEEVLNTEIRPYVELDEGGIEVQELLNDKELVIAYTGSCTSCFSSIGATLSTVQQILRSKVYADLVVLPNMENLKF